MPSVPACRLVRNDMSAHDENELLRRLVEELKPWELNLPISWVPFLHAGCAMHFCVDTASPEGPVFLFDPNPGPPLEQCLVWKVDSFAEFLRLWLDGELDRQVVWPDLGAG